jgi:hypothetical protein
MKIFLTFATALGLLVSARAATTTITVSGQQYTVTYQEGVTFDAYESTIEAADWWTDSAFDGATAATWANAATEVSGLRFAYGIEGGGGNIFYQASDGDGTSTWSNAATNVNGDYAISAVAVPAPFPILGILPIVGFLKRMRRRQRAS